MPVDITYEILKARDEKSDKIPLLGNKPIRFPFKPIPYNSGKDGTKKTNKRDEFRTNVHTHLRNY